MPGYRAISPHTGWVPAMAPTGGSGEIRSRVGPALPKANVDHLIVWHRVGQVADRLCECVDVGNGFLADDGIVKPDIALDRPHDELRGIRRKLALPDLLRERRIGAQHALRLD